MQGPGAFQDYLRPVPWRACPLDLTARFNPQEFALFRVVDGDKKEGLFTGYYEPELAGSLTKDAINRYPVYSPPPEPSRLARAQIESGMLEGQGLELLYCADRIALFFLHIQGSGAVRLPDGSVQRIGFAAKNGRVYTAIGRLLKVRGLLSPPVTMQAIKAWCGAHPTQADALLQENESFIFFQLRDDGPVGAAGHILAPETSLAVDDAIWPYGIDVIVETRDPLNPSRPWVRLMKTADTGSAIKGVIRGDIFFGAGALAEQQAGAMQATGAMWVILPA